LRKVDLSQLNISTRFINDRRKGRVLATI